MKKFEYTITDPNGIHARPAGLLVQESGKYKSTITLTKDDTAADMKRIFSIMSLGVKGGDTVKIEITGPDENAAADAIRDIFANNL